MSASMVAARVFGTADATTRSKVVAIAGLLIVATAAAWLLAHAAFATRPLLLGTAFLAYTFGLRHAVDADHISAIDNVTRALVHRERRPVSAGLWFSLGHSTVVVILSIAIAVAASVARGVLPVLERAGGVIGTAVSATFLLIIAAINLIVLRDVVARYRTARGAGAVGAEVVDTGGGFLARVLRPLTRGVRASWQMYPLGLLFGLGFDTATEVGVLGIAALEGSKGLPVCDILVFPLLFTVGMAAIDTADGILMLGAYGWASIDPMRKLAYNVWVTAVSVLVAVVVAAIELTGLLAEPLGLGAFGAMVARIDDNFGVLGTGIVALFAIVWAVAFAVYRRAAVRRREPEASVDG